jgi:hypothetical protein
MKCDICGGQIPKNQGVMDTKGERTRNAGPYVPADGFNGDTNKNRFYGPLPSLCPVASSTRSMGLDCAYQLHLCWRDTKRPMVQMIRSTLS